MFTLSLFLALKLSPRGAPLSVASLAGRGPAGTKHAVVACSSGTLAAITDTLTVTTNSPDSILL